MSFRPAFIPRVRQSAYWAVVETPNSRRQSFKQTADTASASNEQIEKIVFLINNKGEQRIRVSQAYSGVGHTYGLQVVGPHLVVHDHSVSRLYEAKSFPSYNRLIDTVARRTGLKVVFAPKVVAANKDPAYKEKCESGDGPCVYYFDKYVFGK